MNKSWPTWLFAICTHLLSCMILIAVNDIWFVCKTCTSKSPAPQWRLLEQGIREGIDIGGGFIQQDDTCLAVNPWRSVKVIVCTLAKIYMYIIRVYIYKHIYANCIVKCNNPETNRVTDYSPHMISYYQDVSSMTRWSGSILNRLQSDQSTPWKDTNSDYVNVCDTFAVIWTIV